MPSLTVRTAEAGREEVRQAILIYKKLKKKNKNSVKNVRRKAETPYVSI